MLQENGDIVFFFRINEKLSGSLASLSLGEYIFCFYAISWNGFGAASNEATMLSSKDSHGWKRWFGSSCTMGVMVNL